MHISQIEKEKFLQALDEDSFRDQVVRRLFKARGFRDGRDLCGPEEYGKDAIFVEEDKFGVLRYSAVQTKVGSITMAGDPSKNLHTILSQLRTALDTPHFCVSTKSKCLPSVVYLIASGKINDKAQSHIVDTVKDPRLSFMDRDSLIAAVDQWCPEVWSGITAQISPYLKALASQVEDLTVSVIGLGQAHSGLGAFAAASDANYQDVTLGYQELVNTSRNGKFSTDLDYLELKGRDLFRGNGVRALVLGDAGSGKTTLLVRLAYRLAKEAVISTKSYRIPVFIRAGDALNVDLAELYASLSFVVTRSYRLDSPPFSLGDFEEGRVVLMIDGLDELASTLDRQRAIDLCLHFCDKFPKCSLALTTRPYSSIDQLEGLSAFRRYRVSSLSVADAEKMLAKLGNEKEPSADALWRRETLRRLEAIHGVDLNPLLVTVFAVSTRLEKNDVPANITELFAKFTELMLGRWDGEKGLGQQYQSKIKEEILSEFAFQLHSSGETKFRRPAFAKFVGARLEEMNRSADIDILLREILDRSGLLRGTDEMEFKHHLLQEYFAAKGIPDLAFVESNIGNDWWRNSVVFYFGGQPKAAHQLLEVTTSQALIREESFITVGLSLQACYMSKMEDRLDVWKWVADSVSAALQSRLFGNADPKYPTLDFLSKYLESRDSLALIGLDKAEYGITRWCSSDKAHQEFRTFCFAVALGELGDFEGVLEIVNSDVLSNDLLLLALHFGSFFSRELRAIQPHHRVALEAIIKKLAPRVELHRYRVTEEYRGQLLEYRKGGVIALDAPEPFQG